MGLLNKMFGGGTGIDVRERVRKDALGSLSAVMPIEQAVDFYRHILAQNQTESVHWAVMDGVRFKDEAPAKQLLSEMTQSPYPDVARAAREAMS